MDGDKESEGKNPHPREKCNPLVAITFVWLAKLFWTGYHRDLEVSDLYKPLKEHKSSLLGNKFEVLWEDEKKRKKPSLLRVIVRCYGLECAKYGLVLFVLECFIRAVQPLFLGRLIMFFTSRKSAVTETEAYIYACAVLLCSTLNVFMMHPYMLAIFHMGMKFRVACCSLLYRKSLKLSKTALGETTVGQMVNLLSNDVNRFDVAIIFLHYLWIGPLMTLITLFFMWREVGAAAAIGVTFMLSFIPLQAWMGQRSSVLRLRTALRTDERVRLMNEIISGIQVIKMYTWEEPFARLVHMARKREIQEIRRTSYIRGLLYSFMMFVTRVSLFLSILTYVLQGNEIVAEKVFILASYYNILRETMTVFFPQGIAQVAEAKVSIRRLQNFMLYEETIKPLHESFANQSGVSPSRKQSAASDTKSTRSRNRSSSPQSSLESDFFLDPKFDKLDDAEKAEALDDVSRVKNLGDKPSIILNNVTARWIEGQSDDTLSNITMKVRPGSLVAVIGPVGAGKTSLLHVLLKEMPVASGSLEINGTISYASQEPWLFVGSVRQNILFGAPMDRLRYQIVVRKCALERDFALLPRGDKTVVGERGISLSGGQRARINLARAVYRQADIFLLDDPLSAVDTHVGRQLFDNCIVNYLGTATRILITHQLQYLNEVDHIIIMKNGRITAEGTFDALQASGLDFDEILKADSDDEDQPEPIEPTEDRVTKDRVTRDLTRHSSVHSFSSLVVDENLPPDTSQEEQRSRGTIGRRVYGAYLRAAGPFRLVATLFFVSITAQVISSGSDYWIMYWVNKEELVSKNSGTGPSPGASRASLDDTVMVLDGGSYLTRAHFVYIYTAIIIMLVTMTLSRSFMFYWLATQASTNLHNTMFQSITRATMRFFHTNPSGRILNRFSKDMGSIDEVLPSVSLDVLQISLTLLGVLVVIMIINYWLLIPTVLLLTVFYFLRKVYVSTSRSIKRLEGVTRSPVFSHLSASLQGLTTIRVFGAQRILEKEFDAHQDLHSSAWYLFIASSRAFGYCLDLVCIMYLSFVTLSFLFIGRDNMGGNVGLAITQAMGLMGMFQWGMRQSTEVENQMTSVERVIEYCDIEREPALESTPENKPRESWPERGELIVEDVWLSYSPSDDEPALRGLTFSLMPQERLGIVGRTGAGKSSIISALFRLAYIKGVIKIDGIDTARLGLHDLRAQLAIIPQEPVLFSGTMRMNLDPFSQYNDDVLWKALEDVEMKDVVLEMESGLNSKVAEGGTNLSVGQRQLVCLARAVIRKNKILIMDEATANVDPQTDGFIQMTIRDKFADCTVLTIAHRLHTIMDSDKVLVMDAGRAVEFDHPYILLRRRDGVLRGMAMETGKGMFQMLIKIAHKYYKRKERQKRAEELMSLQNDARMSRN